MSDFPQDSVWSRYGPYLSGVVLDFRTIAIHAGTNHIPHGDPIIILHRYRYLLKSIWKANHSARIIASGILPRDVNCFEGARNNFGFIDSCNGKAREINAGLIKAPGSDNTATEVFLSTQPLVSTDEPPTAISSPRTGFT